MFTFLVTPTSSSQELGVQLLKKYIEFSDVFDKVKANRLPEHRPYDCPIDLQPGKEPSWGPIYNLSPTELEVLRECIDENLANGFIQHSRSPTGAPIFFVKKKDGSLRLVHVDPKKRFILEADASDFALGSALSQIGNDGLLHPVAFHSQKFEAAEINYEIHDKELLAIVDSFQQWHHFLEGSSQQILVYIDHKNLQYFQSARVLSRRQAHCVQFLIRFDFIILYRPGMQQGKADALSRRPYMELQPGENW